MSPNILSFSSLHMFSYSKPSTWSVEMSFISWQPSLLSSTLQGSSWQMCWKVTAIYKLALLATSVWFNFTWLEMETLVAPSLKGGVLDETCSMEGKPKLLFEKCKPQGEPSILEPSTWVHRIFEDFGVVKDSLALFSQYISFKCWQRGVQDFSQLAWSKSIELSILLDEPSWC